MSGKGWYYFGCGRGPGHYLFGPGPTPYQTNLSYGSPLYRLGNHFDGTLPPQPEAHLYRAALSRLGGWNLTALSWWDRSEDKRGASNSTIFAPGLEISRSELVAEARTLFPWVFARLPQELTFEPWPREAQP